MHITSKAAALAAAAVALPLIATGPANAADLGPSYDPRFRPIDRSPRYYTPPPVWQGLYIGGHLGYGWGDAVPDGFASSKIELSGITGGLHAGYNWQIGNVVAGLEIDGSLARIDGDRNIIGPVSIDAKHDWLSSGRVRLGYAWNNILFYGTGGVAYGGLRAGYSSPLLSESVSNTQFGWVAGGGVEMKFTDMISGRIEALHYGFGDKTFNYSIGSTSIDADVTTVRAGLSLHFN